MLQRSLPILPPPERSSLASTAKGFLGPGGPSLATSSAAAQALDGAELPAPLLASSSQSFVSSMSACFEQLASLISVGEGPAPLSAMHAVASGTQAVPRRRLPSPPFPVGSMAQEVSSPSTSKSEQAKPSTATLPQKQRGSYINAGGQVYWLNYDEPMDLQRLPSSSLDGSVSSAARSAAVARAAKERPQQRAASSTSGLRRTPQTSGPTANAPVRSSDGLLANAEVMDEEAPPSPSPEEPLLPETPQIRRQRPTRPEVPKLWTNRDSVKRSRLHEHGARRFYSNGGIAQASESGIKASGPFSARMLRAHSGIWSSRQQEGEETPRWASCWAPCGGAAAPVSAISAGTPSLPRLPQHIVRRHLSAPRLTCGAGSMSRDALTPRSVSPAPQALQPQLSHHPIPRFHQVPQAPQAQLSHTILQQPPAGSGQPPPQAGPIAILPGSARGNDSYGGRTSVAAPPTVAAQQTSWAGGAGAVQRSSVPSLSASMLLPTPSVILPASDFVRTISPCQLRTGPMPGLSVTTPTTVAQVPTSTWGLQ